MRAEIKSLIVRKKQINFMYDSLVATIISVTIGILTLSYVLWDIESIRQQIIGWFVLNAIILNWRYQVFKKYKKKNMTHESQSWFYKFVVGAMLTGFINGSFIFFLSPSEQAGTFYLFLMVSAMVMATITSIGIIKEAYILYIVSLTTPTFIYFNIYGGEQFLILTISLLVIVLFSISGAFRFSKSIERAFDMELENGILQDKISVEYGEKIIIQKALELKATELEKLNKTLEQKVEEEVEKNLKKSQILHQQSKMASMGEMIGNIAHQWRQPLNTISITAGTLQLEKELGSLEDKSFFDGLDSITRSTKQLSQTIDDFRNFFKPNKNEDKFSVLDVIKDTIRLLEANFQNREITVVYDIEDINTVGLKNELTQAIINILNNAKDVLVEKNIEKKLIIISAYRDNDDLFISIQDNAGGVPKEIIDKIFEPYFTTKHQSSGTGIGLYMTEEIIKKHMEGYIQVVNNSFIYKGESYFGAEFKITLPIKELVLVD